MNKVIEQLKAHRSIRKYRDREVAPQILNQVIEAATYASTSGNMQAYSIVVTKDKAMKEKLYKAHFQQSMLMEAPVFLTFCADFNRMRSWVKLRKAANNFDNYMSFMIASIDAILASQNAAIAAESLGLGICYMGTTLASASEIGKVLELPEHVIPIVGFSLGYADESPSSRKRLPLSSLVHNEKYGNYTGDDLNSIYEEKEREGFTRYDSIPEIKEMGIENLAQVYTQYKYTEESHIRYSEDLLSYIKEQGFMN